MDTARKDYSNPFLVKNKTILFMHLYFSIFQILFQLFNLEPSEEMFSLKYVLDSTSVLLPVEKPRFTMLSLPHQTILKPYSIRCFISFDRIMR